MARTMPSPQIAPPVCPGKRARCRLARGRGPCGSTPVLRPHRPGARPEGFCVYAAHRLRGMYRAAGGIGVTHGHSLALERQQVLIASLQPQQPSAVPDRRRAAGSRSRTRDQLRNVNGLVAPSAYARGGATRAPGSSLWGHGVRPVRSATGIASMIAQASRSAAISSLASTSTAFPPTSVTDAARCFARWSAK